MARMSAASAEAWLERAETVADRGNDPEPFKARASVEAQIAQAYALERIAAALELFTKEAAVAMKEAIERDLKRHDTET
jgi:hypothetical protein